MRYGGEEIPAASADAPGQETATAPGDARDDESVLTPLPSEYGDEDEDQGRPLDIDEVKASADILRQHLAAMQPAQEAESQPDFVRPGVEDKGEINIPTSEHSYERTGVSHLTHSWHAQGHERTTVS
jgi:hypothetical protein